MTLVTDPVVLPKRDAVAHWVTTVNTSNNVHTRWAYLEGYSRTVRKRLI